MFDNLDLPKSLEEEKFHEWLESGREHKISYSFLLIVWDDFESNFLPVYAEDREKIEEYQSPAQREKLIAAYDIYSESRVF